MPEERLIQPSLLAKVVEVDRGGTHLELRLLGLSIQIVLEEEGTVVLFVLGGVDKSDRPGSGSLPQVVDQINVLIEFCPIPFGKLVPLARVMSEPTAQPGAGGYLFRPVVDRRLLLA